MGEKISTIVWGLAMSRRSRNKAAPDRGWLALAVESGQVACPRRGMVDMEACFRCRDYAGFESGPLERLVCGASRRSEIFTPFGVIPT